MEPETVVVRVFGGAAIVRWIVQPLGKIAYITNSAGREAMVAGTNPEVAVGFPLTDVFKWDPLNPVADGETPDWATLKQWGAD